jgi:hypothetical protein
MPTSLIKVGGLHARFYANGNNTLKIELTTGVIKQLKLSYSLIYNKIIMLVSFAGVSLIRFNGSRINGLSHKWHSDKRFLV